MRRFFCRECITEHEDKVLCAACLRRLIEPSGKTSDRLGGLFQLGHFLLGILILYVLFYYFAQVLLALPSDFHEGTLWQTRLVDGIMKKSHKKHQKSAIRMIEEAVHILRAAPGALLSAYYIGSVPFVLGLLYFWADMSRSAKAYEYSAVAALGLSFLFVWMKFWQTVFMFQIRAQFFNEIPPPWSLQRIGSIAATQSLIQSTRFLVLPIASLMVIPFGFCYAFYQNVAAHDDSPGPDGKVNLHMGLAAGQIMAATKPSAYRYLLAIRFCHFYKRCHCGDFYTANGKNTYLASTPHLR